MVIIQHNGLEITTQQVAAFPRGQQWGGDQGGQVGDQSKRSEVPLGNTSEKPQELEKDPAGPRRQR